MAWRSPPATSSRPAISTPAFWCLRRRLIPMARLTQASTSAAGTGVWTASGATADVNTLLAGVTFNPAANFSGSFTIATSVSDGSLSVSGTKVVTGIAVNDAPAGTDSTVAIQQNGAYTF